MNWLIKLLKAKPKNPSEGWVRTPGLQLEFDLYAVKLNGVGIGDMLERLEFLGKAELYWSAKRQQATVGMLFYPGLTIGFNNARISSFDIAFALDADDRHLLDLIDAKGFEPFMGRLLYREELNWNADTSEAEVEAHFGKAAERYDEVTEDGEPYSIAAYKFYDYDQTVHFYQGKVTRISITKL